MRNCVMNNRSVNCPFCAQTGLATDVTRNLHIRGDGVYNCFRCGARPSKTGLLPIGLFPDFLVMQGGIMSRRITPDAPTRIHPHRGCSACAAYLTSRNMFTGGTPPGMYGGWLRGHRIFFQAGNYWQGRAINPRNPLPYLAPTDVRPELMDMDPTKGRSKTLCVVEGPFDGLRLYQEGFRAVVLFGKTFTESKIAALQDLRPKKIIWCLDADVEEFVIQEWALASMSFASIKLWYLQWAGKDPAAASTMDIQHLHQLVKGGA